MGDPEKFAQTWDAAEDLWQERWLDAFTPKGTSTKLSGHYSGSLPVLKMEESIEGAALQRIYYMACYAILSAERTNLPLLFPRVYVTATGNAFTNYMVGIILL